MIITSELTCRMIITIIMRSVSRLTNCIVHPSILSIDRFIFIILYVYRHILYSILSFGRLKTRKKETFTGVDSYQNPVNYNKRKSYIFFLIPILISPEYLLGLLLSTRCYIFFFISVAY